MPDPLAQLLDDERSAPSALDVADLPPAVLPARPAAVFLPLGAFEAEDDTLELERPVLPGPVVTALVSGGAVSLLALAGALALG